MGDARKTELPKPVADFNRRLRKRLIELRKENELNQREAAAKCGMTQQQYQKIEVGRHNNSIAALYQVASAFNLTLGELLDFI